ncbi:MAG TPA: tripartite tricarboxylate transporter substrate-binding protein [Pseudolabrys sp.]
MIRRRDVLLSSVAALGAAALPRTLAAQSSDFPNRPIRMIVPFAAGGGVDVFARLLAEKLKETKGYTVVVDNRSGASGTVGGQAVRQAAADGYTVLFSAGTHMMAQSVMKSAPYDPITDFTPIARAGEAPMLLVMSPKLPQKNITEIVADARQKPDSWTFATSALGSPGYLATIAFNKLAGLNLTIAPYRGTAPGLTDVAAGHVQLLIDPVLALLPMARGGQVKAIALTASKRSNLAPDIPTAAEAGMPGLDHSSWYGVWGPKGMPADQVAAMNAAINEAIKALAASGQLVKIGVEPVIETPQQFDTFARGYQKRGDELLKSVNFQPT